MHLCANGQSDGGGGAHHYSFGCFGLSAVTV